MGPSKEKTLKNKPRSLLAATLSGFTLAAILLSASCQSRGSSSDPTGAARPPSASAVSTAPSIAPPSTEMLVKAQELAQRFILLDGHIDVPDRLVETLDTKGAIAEDLSQRTPKGDFDWPRAKAGGLDAPFMSIYVPADKENNGAKELAEKLIGIVESIAAKWPDKFALARSPGDVRTNTSLGKISLPMGMENGAPIENKLENVKYFHDRGIRYITLTHSKDNHISDSSYDEHHTHKGLSEFGKKVVGEMNRVGIMIDVSHISDDAFWQVMELSRTPVIASHSSCRHFTPGFERNMNDDMIKALAKKGGVIQIAFGSSFIDGDIQRTRREAWKRFEVEREKRKLKDGSPEAKAFAEEFEKNEIPKRYATLKQVADHIDHVVKLVGVEHVGLGSDFDGVGDSLPEGLKDVSGYPNLIRALLERGYSEADIEKIASGNVLRVWQAVEDYGRASAR
jgi:membrane dipeptidase